MLPFSMCLSSRPLPTLQSIQISTLTCASCRSCREPSPPCLAVVSSLSCTKQDKEGDKVCEEVKTRQTISARCTRKLQSKQFARGFEALKLRPRLRWCAEKARPLTERNLAAGRHLAARRLAERHLRLEGSKAQEEDWAFAGRGCCDKDGIPVTQIRRPNALPPRRPSQIKSS